jgi:hypothetical protein
MHPITVLQAALVEALNTDGVLLSMGVLIYDAPPRDSMAPYIAIDRHDVRQRDGDEARVQEHRVLLHCWSDQPSRKLALDIAERVLAVAPTIVPDGLMVTHAEHMRTETLIDGRTGQARAAITLRFFTE